MEHVDLLYSGLMLTALMLSLWAAILVTAACIFFCALALRSPAHRSRARTCDPESASGRVEAPNITRGS